MPLLHRIGSWRAWLIVLVLPGALAHAQSDQRYTVTDMSTGSGVRLSELNAQAALARTTDELVARFRSALSALNEGYVRFREKTDKGKTRYIYWIASNRVARDDLASLASRGDLLDQVTSMDELALLLSDTLAVVGDLNVRVEIPRLPATQGEWILYWTMPGGNDFRPLTIPVSGDTLLIARSLFPSRVGNTVEVVLRNTRREGVNLGHALLRFLLPGERKEMQAWMCAQLRDQPELSRNQQLDLAARMMRQVHGHGYRPDLSLLLCR
jgi:hypothetical protein